MGVVTVIPGDPGGRPDHRGKQRVVGVGDLDDALGPPGHLVDAPADQLRHRRDQPQPKIDGVLVHRVLERRAQVVVVGQHPL
ncbi:hypothetical protein, partial [Mycobacterium shinjukuense]|uniref:hypothetical protein n=1 Tax=Mycobacterium shinjukuense TaxID=398694 RepID=UPI0021F2A629